MVAPPPLTAALTRSAIDEACCRAASSETWSFRRATEQDFAGRGVHADLLFGVVASTGRGCSEASSSSHLTTFYFAYSTWDGRVLYLDQVGFEGDSLAVRRLLADIAVKCNCSR